MIAAPLTILEVVLLEPKLHCGQRGFFFKALTREPLDRY
jgi:hypothetical protein